MNFPPRIPVFDSQQAASKKQKGTSLSVQLPACGNV
jgi:hypothetical protein